MIHIQAHWLALVIFAGALAWVGYGLWRSGRPLTMQTAIAGIKMARDEAVEFYNTIKLGVAMAQERKRKGKIESGEEAKEKVIAYVLRKYPAADRAELSETIDGIYWLINQFGDKLPDIDLQGESFLEKLQRQQAEAASRRIPTDIDELSATLPSEPNLG